MRLKSFDNFLITSMSCLALMCLYMLYGVKLVNFNSAGETQVASIVDQLKTVKRKRDFYQGWVDVKAGDGLSENDEIYTHGQSSAKINFINGPEISLFENSLLRIKRQARGSTFSLDKGNLIAKLDKDSPNLDIELNGKKYSFNSQDANIQIEQGVTENKFVLMNGKARLLDQDILPNQVVIQNIKTGDLKIKTIPVIPKLPVHNIIQYYLKETTLNFTWDYTGQSLPVKLMVARDSNFKEIFYQETIEGNSHQVPFYAAGTYYWKLATQNQVDSPIKAFTLIEETPLIVNIDQTLIYQGPKSKEKVFLNWHKNAGKNFSVRVNDEVFETNKNNFEYTPENLGDYAISVKINDKQRPLALWSEPIKFTVLESKPIAISSLTPELMEKVNYTKSPVNYLLSWSGPSGGVNYKIKILKNNKILEMESEHTSIPLNLEEAGEYTWEVQGEMISSGVLSNKISGKIIIKAPLNLTQLPSEGAVIELEKPDQLVTFKWDEVDNTTAYQFELSDTPAFKNIIVARDVDVNNITTSLAKTGRYFWRVKLKKGDSIEYSNPTSVEIKPSPPLARPEITPSIKIKLQYLEEKSSSFNLIDLFISRAHAADPVTFAEWDLPENPKANNYIVEIYKDADLTELIARIETTKPHVTWKNATPGIFYWRVAYIDFWGRKTEFSKVSTLSTEVDPKFLKPAPVEIQLINPKHKASILNEEADQATLEWEAVPEVKSYQVLVASELEFENIIFNKKTNDNKIKISCKDFDSRAGDYYWKIVSGENLSKRRLFHVSCTPPPKIEETPVVKVAEKVEETLPAHFLKLGFFPHHISYQNKAQQYTAKVDGNALNSWYASYQRPLDLKYFQLANPTLAISRGKVFNSITFTDIEMILKLKRLQSTFSWGPVLSFMKKTLFVESNLSIVDEGFSSPLVGLFIQKEIGRLTLNAEAKIGSLVTFGVDTQYRMKNNFSAGFFLDSTSVTKDNNKHSFSRYGLNLNYTFDFFDASTN